MNLFRTGCGTEQRSNRGIPLFVGFFGEFQITCVRMAFDTKRRLKISRRGGFVGGGWNP